MAPILIPDVVLRTVGRTPCTAPLAVVLHEYDSGIEALDAQMGYCPRPRPTCPTRCHTSFHYGIGGNCTFHQYVPITDTAWGFAVTPPTCPEPVCPPDPCLSCTGLTADQYNQDINGVAPTLPAFSADACGTANSCVIHIAVTNLFPTNQALGSGPCCAPNAAAYRCLVSSLCYIFAQADLTPSLSTLLVHCSELVCLDINQLVADVLAFNCAVVPVSPCINCPDNTTLEVAPADGTNPVLTASVLTVDLVVDPAGNNSLVVGPSGILAPDVTVTDSATIDFTAAANNVTGSVKLSAQAGNHVVAKSDGLFSGGELFDATTVVNAGTIDPTLGFDLWKYTGAPGGTITLADPIAGEKQSVYVKNLAAGTVTIIAASNIDGVPSIILAGTIPAGYPFGNNGGEAVHLVFSAGTWNVM